MYSPKYFRCWIFCLLYQILGIQSRTCQSYDILVSYSTALEYELTNIVDHLMLASQDIYGAKIVLSRSLIFGRSNASDVDQVDLAEYQLNRVICRHNVIIAKSCFDFQTISLLSPFKETSSFAFVVPSTVNCADSDFSQLPFVSGSFRTVQLDPTFSGVQAVYERCTSCRSRQVVSVTVDQSEVSSSLHAEELWTHLGIQTLPNYSDWYGGILQVVARRYPELTDRTAEDCSYHARMRSSRDAKTCKPIAVVSIMETVATKLNATLRYHSSFKKALDPEVIGLASLDDPLASSTWNSTALVSMAQILYRGDIFTSLVYCVARVDLMDLDLWFWVRPFALDPTSIILLMFVGVMLDVCAKGHIQCSNWVYREKLLTTSGIRIYSSVLLMLLCAIYECNLSSDVTIPSPPIRITTFRELVVDKRYKIQGVPTLDPSDPVYRVMLDSFESEGLSQGQLDNSLTSYEHSSQEERTRLLAQCQVAILTTDDDIVLDPESFYALDSYPDIKCNRLRNDKRALKFKHFFIKGGKDVLQFNVLRLIDSGIAPWLYDYENHVSLWRNRRKVANARTELEQPMAFNMSHWRITPTFILWTVLLLMSSSFFVIELLTTNILLLSFCRDADAVEILQPT